MNGWRDGNLQEVIGRMSGVGRARILGSPQCNESRLSRKVEAVQTFDESKGQNTSLES